MSELITPVGLAEQHYNDMKEYATYVQHHRTTPEFRDGLKPVQRRTLYAAYFTNHATGNTKSMQIIGSTLGTLHPHGDSSVQGALYNMYNWYSSYMPLVSGQGNFGNTFQNVGASPRYTEVRLSNFTMDCILDELISCRECVDWTDNYDQSRKEPIYLPVKVPLLLINGSNGIAVGDRIDIPSNNINEVIDATIALIKNPNYKVVLRPDHCQSCTIVDTDWNEFSEGGPTNYVVRGHIDIKEYDAGKKYAGHTVLAIRSLPNETFLEPIIEKIEKMVKENKIIGIKDTEDHSTENNLNYYIILQNGADPHFIMNALYKNTALQTTCRINFKALDGNKSELDPARIVRYSYTEYLKYWLDFRRMTKHRVLVHKIRNLKTRMHMLENYIDALEKGYADDIVKIVRSDSKADDDVMIEKIIKKCKVTDIQAKFFINCEVKKLSKGYLKSYKEEYAKKIKDIDTLNNIILTPGGIDKEIIRELKEIKDKYGCPRRCDFIKESAVTGIPEGTFKVVITEKGYIKKIGQNDLITRPKNDNISFVIEGDNSKNLIIFDTMGKMYNLPISKVPFADRNSSGIDIRLINKNINSQIIGVQYGPVFENTQNGYLITVTRNGYIKKMLMSDFVAVPASGLVYCKVDPGDTVVSLLYSTDGLDTIIYTDKKCLRVSSEGIPLLKRNARGCIAMSSKRGVVIQGATVGAPQYTDIVIVTKNGYFNKIPRDVIGSGRGKAGNNMIKLGKGDSIVKVYGCHENCILDVFTISGAALQVPVNLIPKGTSISTGDRLRNADRTLMIKEPVVEVQLQLSICTY